MTQTFHLGVLEREVRRVKKAHLDTVDKVLSQYFKNQTPPPLPEQWTEFNSHCPAHFDYLLELYALSCYLSRPRYADRLEKAFMSAETPSFVRRSVSLIKQIETISMDVFDSYCRLHHRDVSQTFVRIQDRIRRNDKTEKTERDIAPPTSAGICYALSLSGTDYFLGHILVSESKSMPERDIKVAVMTKESVSHTPRVTAVALCTLRYVPNCHRLYRQFIILDTRDQGLYDFTILINRVTRSFEDIKSILVADRNIQYVITPVP